MPFAPEYVRHVLNENFEDAKALLLSPLMAINYAHLVMLAQCGIVSREDARTIRGALDAVRLEEVRAAAYDGSCEDLFFYVERLLVASCGEAVAGRLHTARSRNDIDMTMYRMRLREDLLAFLDGTLALRRALLTIAERHRDTIFAAHTHTQPAQPTTVAHYLLGVIEQLERDGVRLRAAFETANRNPLGACAITGTGFPIDRGRTSALLGFSAPTGNTWGSIATVDYLLESASALSVALVGLGRCVQDLLLWCTAEVGYLRLADGFVQTSSIMPQKRNPVALEHARALASKAVGQAGGILLAVHNTPFGDIVDTEDDLQPLVASTFHDGTRAVSLVAAAMASADFDAARMREGARRGFITITELADVLARDHGLPFVTAHRVAAAVARSGCGGDAAAQSAALAATSTEIAGREIRIDAPAMARLLSPEHFVAVRTTHGGPAPDETARAIGASAVQVDADAAWLEATRRLLAEASSTLRAAAAAL